MKCVSIYIIYLMKYIFSFTDQSHVLNILQGMNICHVKDIFLGYGKFPGYCKV